MNTSNWQIEASCGEAIHGTTHQPNTPPKGVVLMAHGFKGYKDYGMFPWLATNLADLGYIVHRFNFSHSGMLAGDGQFERLDLFEKSTWNSQVNDLKVLANTFKQEGLPLILFGHSRGGVATILAAGRGEVDVAGVISLSAPCTSISMADDIQKHLLDEGRIESPSGRTGQMLYVGKAFLEEQFESPQSHDVLTLASGISIPCLIIHGEGDPTVSVDAGEALSSAITHSVLAVIEGGDHVYNTPNPFAVDSAPSPQLASVWNAMETWLTELRQ
jgi:alpha-beta hydrolase superfamily lysophospholipase